MQSRVGVGGDLTTADHNVQHSYDTMCSTAMCSKWKKFHLILPMESAVYGRKPDLVKEF